MTKDCIWGGKTCMDTAAQSQMPRWKTALNMMINPGQVVKEQMTRVPWPFSLAVSGLAFTLFFLQTGLDMFRANQISQTMVILISGIGFVYGTLGIVLIAALAWGLCQGSQSDRSLTWTISSFALGYSATFIYALSGLVFSLAFGWKTAVAFGITGVLWALRPNIFTIRALSGERTGFSVALATVCGALLLFGWALLGRLGL